METSPFASRAYVWGVGRTPSPQRKPTDVGRTGKLHTHSGPCWKLLFFFPLSMLPQNHVETITLFEDLLALPLLEIQKIWDTGWHLEQSNYVTLRGRRRKLGQDDSTALLQTLWLLWVGRRGSRNPGQQILCEYTVWRGFCNLPTRVGARTGVCKALSPGLVRGLLLRNLSPFCKLPALS